MADITVCAVVKNEADRFLEPVLAVWSDFAARIVVIDDGSTDRTPEILGDFGCEVHQKEVGLWGNEAQARQYAWLTAVEGSEWLFVLDADMIPATPPEMRGGVGLFHLFDLWEPLKYREDAFWQAHKRPRAWAAHVGAVPGHTWLWEPPSGMHYDPMPSNVWDCGDPMVIHTALLHYAYVTPELRAEKAAKYAAVEHLLEPAQTFHARSILNPKPRLFDLPFEPEYTLL